MEYCPDILNNSNKKSELNQNFAAGSDAFFSSNPAVVIPVAVLNEN